MVKPRIKFDKAFSLMELVIIILILSVIGAIGIFIPTGGNRLEGAANKLMFDLRYAQQLAISRQVSCGAAFDFSGNNYFIYIGSLSTKAIDPATQGEFLVSYNSGDYQGVVLLSSSFGDRLWFDYLGRPYGGSDTLLSAQGILSLREGTSTRSVTIQPNTGEVKLP